jgi:hypothetical protein
MRKSNDWNTVLIETHELSKCIRIYHITQNYTFLPKYQYLIQKEMNLN